MGVGKETAEELQEKARKVMGLEGEVRVYLATDGRRSEKGDFERDGGRKDREHTICEMKEGEK